MVFVDLDSKLGNLLLVLIDGYVQLADLVFVLLRCCAALLLTLFQLINLDFIRIQLLGELINSDVELVDLTFVLLLLSLTANLLVQLADLSLVSGELLGQLGNPDIKLVNDSLALIVLELPFIGQVDLAAFILKSKNFLVERPDFSIFLSQDGTEPFELIPTGCVSPFILNDLTESIDLISEERIFPHKNRVIVNNFGAK